MKRQQKGIAAVLLCFLILGTSGCMGRSKFTDTQSKQIREQGQPYLEAFLDTLPAEKITDENYHMADAAQEGSLLYCGRYPANAVCVEFTADGRHCKAVVDLETETIYSDYYMFDLNRQLERQLKPYCERYGFNGAYSVKGAHVYITIHSHDVEIDGKSNKRTDSYVDLEDMIPVTFCQQEEDERADAYLQNAPVSAFSISYTIQEDELFDPRILSDYLTESGNCKVEETRARVLDSYEITGRKEFDVFPDSGVALYSCGLTYHGENAPMTYAISRTGFHREQNFCFTYRSGEMQGDVASYERENFTECEFPIEIKNGKLRYFGNSENEYVTLRFEKEPQQTFTRTCYKYGIAEETEKLIAVENEDGMWYLTLESRNNAYWYSYKFDREQDLEFY